jgi:hypothetical protein
VSILPGQLNIVPDLINMLPGNSSMNTVKHTAIEEAVFPVSAAMSCSGGWWSCDMFPVMHVHSLAFFFIASGVGLSPLYCGHFWPIVPAPGDR